MKTGLKNILVQYQGGGYDGCIWEWNYFFIDAEGCFHDIRSSGRAGCDNAQEAELLLLNEDETKYLYDITDSKAIAQFSRESNVVHIKGVLQWFNDNNVPFYTACSDCGNVVEWAEDLHLEDWRGCGGIALTAEKLLCSDCHSMGICDSCNEYVGQGQRKIEYWGIKKPAG